MGAVEEPQGDQLVPSRDAARAEQTSRQSVSERAQTLKFPGWKIRPPAGPVVCWCSPFRTKGWPRC